MKRLDNASNDLFQKVCTGESIDSVEFIFAQPAKTFNHMKYLLENVIISSHHHYMGSDAVPGESMTLIQ